MADTPATLAGLQPDPILGSPIGHYPSDRFRPLLIAALIGGIVAVVLNFTLAAAEAWWGPALTIIIMAGVGLALGWYVLHGWNREIILYERGFTYREGSAVVPLLYIEIRSVRLKAERLRYFGGLVRRDTYHFTVTTERDERFTITNLYRRAPELGTLLTERVEAALRPRIEAALARGEQVAFAPENGLLVSAEGLHANGEMLGWTQFGGWRVGNRQLVLLNTAGEVWFALPLTQVENITLLLSLLKAYSPNGR